MFCQRVKEFLHKHNVAFTDLDITKDEAALAELEKLGVLTTPVTAVDGETMMPAPLLLQERPHQSGDHLAVLRLVPNWAIASSVLQTALAMKRKLIRAAR